MTFFDDSTELAMINIYITYNNICICPVGEKYVSKEKNIVIIAT